MGNVPINESWCPMSSNKNFLNIVGSDSLSSSEQQHPVSPHKKQQQKKQNNKPLSTLIGGLNNNETAFLNHLPIHQRQ